MQRCARMRKELKILTESPPYGISCWPVDEYLNSLEAQIVGGTDTPYSGGIFKLKIQIPERYPFEPPKISFVTPIYHPNIDSAGRICLDTLKMPPKGAWKPILNISSVLTSIQLLMAEPNPADPLMVDISNEFQHNKDLFEEKAKEWTRKHAHQCIPAEGDENTHKTESSYNTTNVDRQKHKHKSDANKQTNEHKADNRKRLLLPDHNVPNKEAKHV